MPIIEEEIDGLSGLLFPFYDPDTHMLYLAGKVHINLYRYGFSNIIKCMNTIMTKGEKNNLLTKTV